MAEDTQEEKTVMPSHTRLGVGRLHTLKTEAPSMRPSTSTASASKEDQTDQASDLIDNEHQRTRKDTLYERACQTTTTTDEVAEKLTL